VLLAIHLIASDCRSMPKLLLAAFCLALSTLIYEAFWFSFLPMAMLVLAIDPRGSWRNALRSFAVLGTAQLSVIGWSLALAANGQGTGKQLNDRYVDVLNSAARWLAEIAGTTIFTAYIIIAITVLLLVFIYWKWSSCRPLVIAFVATAIGAATTITLFYAAGYGMTSKGIFSRTYIGLNVWLALAVCICSIVALRLLKGRVQFILAAVAIVGLVWIGGKTITQNLRWAEAWTFQQKVLSEIPDQPPFDTDQHTAFILLMPNRADRVESIGAPWDSVAAIYLNKEPWRVLIEEKQIWATASQYKEWKTSWDGSKVAQAWCVNPDSPLWVIPAEQVVTFDVMTQTVTRQEPGFSTVC
jgi:hypothetical protein